MRNERLHDAVKITLPVPTGTLSGAPVRVGPFVGVCATKEGEGGNIAGRATVWRTGEFDLSVPEAVAAELTPIYITAANAVTTVATGNSLLGYSHHDASGVGGTKGAGAGTVHVILARV